MLHHTGHPAGEPTGEAHAFGFFAALAAHHLHQLTALLQLAQQAVHILHLGAAAGRDAPAVASPARGASRASFRLPAAPAM